MLERIADSAIAVRCSASNRKVIAAAVVDPRNVVVIQHVANAADEDRRNDIVGRIV